MNATVSNPARALFAGLILIGGMGVAAARAGEAAEKSEPPAAAAPAPAAESGVESRADRILREMSEYLKTAREFTFHADVAYDSVRNSGQRIQFGGAADLAVRRPDRLHVEYRGDEQKSRRVAGAVDAAFVAKEPKAYIDGHPKVARLFPDYRDVERAYFAKTGIFPIMHAVAILRDVADKHPWLPKALFEAYSQAKRMMYQQLHDLGWAMISLPWVGKELEETRKLMGKNYWPYGIEPNRKALEALFQYSYEQGLAKRKMNIADLFHPSTLELVEDEA